MRYLLAWAALMTGGALFMLAIFAGHYLWFAAASHAPEALAWAGLVLIVLGIILSSVYSRE